MPSPELPRPSGLRRTIAALRARLAPGSVEGIDCPRCRDEFMMPLSWEPAAGGYWQVDQCCAQCDVMRTLTLSRAETALMLVRLDQQRGRIERAVERLDRARMEEQAEAFTLALQRDLIAAADFAR